MKIKNKIPTIEEIDNQIYQLRLLKIELIKQKKEESIKQKKERIQLSNSLIKSLKDNKYSIQELSDIVDVTRQTMYRYGKGEIRIDEQKELILKHLLVIDNENKTAKEN